jgi:hypothetical protein
MLQSVAVAGHSWPAALRARPSQRVLTSDVRWDDLQLRFGMVAIRIRGKEALVGNLGRPRRSVSVHRVEQSELRHLPPPRLSR